MKPLPYYLGMPAVLALGLVIGHFCPFLYPVGTFGLFALYLFAFSPSRNKWIRALLLFIFLLNLAASVLLYVESG
jgi:hypothetical protein